MMFTESYIKQIRKYLNSSTVGVYFLSDGYRRDAVKQ